MKHAIVNEEGEVVNTITWDGVTPYNPGQGLEAVPAPDEVQIGWSYDDGTWTDPAGNELEEVEVMPARERRQIDENTKADMGEAKTRDARDKQQIGGYAGGEVSEDGRDGQDDAPLDEDRQDDQGGLGEPNDQASLDQPSHGQPGHEQNR